jgi:ABC transporter substrate binding protein
VIGYLNGTSPEPNAPQLAAFRQGLSETGWAEGQNVAIEYRWAEFHYDRLPALAADLVSRKVDVIAACGGNGEALAAQSATSTIPIVFATGADPVGTALVAGLAQPGGKTDPRKAGNGESPRTTDQPQNPKGFRPPAAAGLKLSQGPPGDNRPGCRVSGKGEKICRLLAGLQGTPPWLLWAGDA